MDIRHPGNFRNNRIHDNQLQRHLLPPPYNRRQRPRRGLVGPHPGKHQAAGMGDIGVAITESPITACSAARQFSVQTTPG